MSGAERVWSTPKLPTKKRQEGQRDERERTEIYHLHTLCLGKEGNKLEGEIESEVSHVGHVDFFIVIWLLLAGLINSLKGRYFPAMMVMIVIEVTTKKTKKKNHGGNKKKKL